MKQLLLLFGHGGHGKTHLAKRLAAEYGFQSLELDPVYIEFIRSECPMLYFDALGLYIGPHYDSILVHRDYSKTHFGRDFIADWHAHIRSKIKSLIQEHDNVVVEGYLLRDLKDELESELNSSANVFQIEARDKCYYSGEQSLEIEEIAHLGIDETSQITV